MSLFGKKKDESCCSCECGKAAERMQKAASMCCGESVNGICCVNVLGSCCRSCRTLFDNAQEAVKQLGLNVKVRNITELQKIMEYGAMSLPALAVNDKLVSAGRVLSTAEIVRLLEAFR